jgi:3-deoxy-D-manno-octulosonic-acid transferase
VWVVDTLGEMGLWYRLAPIVFVGRSLLPPGGGQNPLEPARLGCAIAVGAYTGNFVGHVGRLKETGGLVVVEGEAGLVGFVAVMPANGESRDLMAERAEALAQGENNVIAQTAQRLLGLICSSAA